ncbi:MAG: DUF1349 domain-containing protein, partial [Actinomycetota bacterium]
SDGQLSARVQPTFAAPFDAGVLFVHQSTTDYAKLCFERSPSGEDTIVSVVTRNTSDDANGPVIAGGSVELRISTFRSVVAFHWSTDGSHWHLARYFRLRDPDTPIALGLAAQSPTGSGCSVSFTEIRWTDAVPDDIRNGT